MICLIIKHYKNMKMIIEVPMYRHKYVQYKTNKIVNKYLTIHHTLISLSLGE